MSLIAYKRLNTGMVALTDFALDRPTHEKRVWLTEHLMQKFRLLSEKADKKHSIN